MNEKPLNVKLQCLASLFLPTGIYAFHRIKKTKIGVIIYGISAVIGYASDILGGSMLYLSQDWWPIIAPLSLCVLGLSISIPIVFIRKYTKEYNSKLQNLTH